MQQSVNFFPQPAITLLQNCLSSREIKIWEVTIKQLSIEQAHFHFGTKISITFWKQYSRIEFCPDLRNSHSGMWRLLASSLGPTLGNSLRKCGSEAAFEDGSHFPNPSSYLAGLISEYFQGAPRIPYKPVFLDGWSPGYVTFAEENQVIVIFSLTFNFNFMVAIVFAYFYIWVCYLWLWIKS